MKKNYTFTKWVTSIACGLLLTFTAFTGLGQSTNTTFTFDTESDMASFTYWWGVTTTMTWDGANDAGGDSNSGSVRYDVAFTGTLGDQFATLFTIANRRAWDGGTVIDASSYTNLSLQILVDPSSGKRTGSDDFGVLEVGIVYIRASDGNWIGNAAGYVTIPAAASNHWVELDYPLNSGLVGIDHVVGFYIKMWANGVMPSELIFNIDNFKLTKPGIVVIPDPTVRISKAIPGLQLTTTSASGQYGRQSIYTVNQGVSWVDAGKPVTYCINIKDAPGSAASGFQTHLFMVPTSAAPYGAGDTAVDWNATNLFWLNIQAAGAQLRYKTNQASGNSMLYNTDASKGGVGALASLACPSPVGVWALTFHDNTSITLTAPNGASTNVSIGADSAALFTGPMFLHFGAQPNDNANIGLASTLTRVWTTNTTDSLDVTFTGTSLDSSIWGLAASDPNGILCVPEHSLYWFGWTLPASSDSYVMGKAALSEKWTDLGLTNVVQLGSSRQVLVPDTALPSTAGFITLGKRNFTKLLVLLPGETYSPGTSTGKAGTPDSQTVGLEFTVTVYAVDEEGYLIKNAASDTLSISSSDEGAMLPENTSLSNGKASFVVIPGTAGNNTFTVTDVTDGTKKSGTSSPVTCN